MKTRLAITRIDPLPIAKLMGVGHAIMGLLFGALFSVFSMIGAIAGVAGGERSALIGLLFGAGAIVIAPIFYGLTGFVFGLLSAALYNVLAGRLGGMVIEAEANALASPAPSTGQ